MSYLMNTYKKFPLTISHGEGVYLYDTEGKKYLDFVAGIATNALGYSNETYQDAITKQINQVMHVSNLYSTDVNEKAAALLAKASKMDQVFFVNSGTEAVEASLKLARIYAKNKYGKEKFEIISMKDSFHGRTMGALSLTGQAKYQTDFEPLLPGVQYATFNDFESLQNKITDNTCAVMIEVIQGEGGITPGNKEYFKVLNQFCKENELLLLIDEVQTGVARTGTMFAYEQFDLKPDIIACAKGLGSGFPVGAICAKQEIADAFTYGKHGTTFGGNPLASTAVKTVLEIIENQKLLKHINKVSKYFVKQLEELKKEFKVITKIKGLGLMLGIEVEGVKPIDIITTCMKHGLLLVGASDKTIRFVPPLVINKTHVDEAVMILKESLREVI